MENGLEDVAKEKAIEEEIIQLLKIVDQDSLPEFEQSEKDKGAHETHGPTI